MGCQQSDASNLPPLGFSEDLEAWFHRLGPRVGLLHGWCAWPVECSGVVSPGPPRGVSARNDIQRGSPTVWLLGRLLVRGTCEKSTGLGRGHCRALAHLPKAVCTSPPLRTWACFFLCNHHRHFSRTCVLGTVLKYFTCTDSFLKEFLKEYLKLPLHRVIWRLYTTVHVKVPARC